MCLLAALDSQGILVKCTAAIFFHTMDLDVLPVLRRGEPEYPEKSLLEQGREPTTNSTYI